MKKFISKQITLNLAIMISPSWSRPPVDLVDVKSQRPPPKPLKDRELTYGEKIVTDAVPLKVIVESELLVAPRADAQVKERIPKGATVVYLQASRSQRFVRVEYQGRSGWVIKESLRRPRSQ